MLIGLDALEPSLVLDEWRGELPTLAALAESGTYGRLTSIVPPITVPAWSCMMASRTPGDLGIYGFRNRADHSYDGMYIANGSSVREPRLWDFIGRQGRRSIVLGVPGTYPPRPLNGVLVSCFLTPSTRSQYTYPTPLRKEIESVVGEYLFDCPNFRTEDKADLLRQIYEMTDRRFALADHLLRTHPWDFFAMVEMGTDRIYHGFWKAMDASHRKHVPGNPYVDAIKDYHVHLDGLISRLLSHADEETVVLVVSDHGAKRMEGGIRVNEWLRHEGYLTTLRDPTEQATLDEVGVDWSRTVAWGEGGYYSRIFMNVEGREPTGVVPSGDYERVRDELARRLAEIPDEHGLPITTDVFRPDDLYAQLNGVPPDLIVHFGGLDWRAVGSVGGDEGIHTFENDTGPDDANHAQEGVLVMAGPGIPHERRDDMHLLDVAPTILEALGIAVPSTMRGSSLIGSPTRPNGMKEKSLW